MLGVATFAVLLKLHLDARSARTERAKSLSEAAVESSRGTAAVAYALMAAGAAVAAAGVALVLRDAWETAGAATVAAVLGGPAVFLVGDSALNRAVGGGIAASRIAALVSLAVLALIGFALPALVLAALAFAVMLVLLLAASGWFRLPSASVDDDTS
ncbi:low temperature requirement protein A [Glycomyces sp. NPDC049804]|uniref:low temperature requirement protein A n=1 Tax=Glycomyces sp. NPDC049804 TaxID=3154363 RepID=UPI0034491EC9